MAYVSKGRCVVAAALFDVDGTLVDSRVWRGILEYPKIDRMRVRMFYVRAIPHMLRLKLDPGYETQFRDQWVRGLAQLLKGWSVAETAEMAHWIASEFLAGAYRQDVIELLKQHKAAGQPVILVSTMFPVVLEAIAGQIGADAAVGTAHAIQNGTLTGAIAGQSCVGPRKKAFAEAYLAQHHEDITLQQCAAYADSLSDVPLLASSPQPCAVYPDAGLRRVAIEHGWRIHPLP